MAQRLILFVLSLWLTLGGAAWAGDVDQDRARNAARNWIQLIVATYGSWGGADMPTILSAEPFKHAGEIVGYNFLISPFGHILVSARDDIPPVKLYSESTTLSLQSPEYQEQIEWISNEIFQIGKLIDSLGIDKTAASVRDNPDIKLWALLDNPPEKVLGLASAERAATDAVSYGPLMSTTWNQPDPYNLHCPLEASGCRTLVGCVATAAGQIMKFWDYPTTGQGSTSYTWNNGQTDVTLSRDFSQRTYDWANMPDNLTSSSTSAQKEAVAKLLGDVGIAYHMDYGCQASSASTAASPTVFKTYFKYSDNAQWVNRTSYASSSAWMQVFKTETQAGRPAMLRVRDPNAGGHAVVVDGYRDSPSESVHLNMGWSGNSNGWYVPDSFSTGSYNWTDTNYQGAAIGLQPSGSPPPPPPPSDAWKTEIGIVNMASATTSGVLRGFNDSGAQVWSQSVSLAPLGRSSLDVTQAAGSTTAALIKSMRLDITGGAAVGYQKFYQSGKYRVGLEALSRANQNGLYLPHIHSDSNWWTGVGLVNTTSSAKSLGFSFSNGAQASRSVDAGGHDSFVINGPFQGTATVSNGAGIAGILLFGTSNQLSGISLRDDTAYTLYFPHVDESSGWWTGAGTYNPNPTQTSITLYGYGQGGNLIGTNAFSIDPYSSHVASTSFGSSVAWFKLESSQPILGFELFGKTTADQLAGYSVTGLNTYQGVFPKLETSGWTGLAFVNIGSATANITLEARNNGGSVIATRTATLAPNAKSVALAEQFFPGQDCSSATYVRFTSDQPLIGFQLNGSSDGTMLDAIPALGSSATYGSSALYFPHIAAE